MGREPAPADVSQAADAVPGVAPNRRDGAEPQARQLGHFWWAGRNEEAAAAAAAGYEQVHIGDTKHWGPAGEHVLTL